jgi:hypothetical protein
MRNGFRFVCKNSVVLLLALFPFLQLGAQSQEVSVGAGDTIVLGKPTSPEVYAYIDIFRKTRWDPKPLPNDEFTQKFGTYDSSTGNGFFRYFFRGDFDAAELPASFEGRKLPILGVEVIPGKSEGNLVNVMYLKTDDPNEIIIVEFDDAMQFGELGTEVLLNAAKR